MNNQFYVVYNNGQYLNDDTGEFGPFTQATQYSKFTSADLMAAAYGAGIVGPYNEGDVA